MIKSMTGYGQVTGEFENKKFTVEIKAINSKGCEINTRIPSYYKEKELDLRNMIMQELQRGKIDVGIYLEFNSNNKRYAINRELAKGYFEELKSLSIELGSDSTDLLHIVMKMPEVLQQDVSELDENEWNKILELIGQAIHDVNKFRDMEGKNLEDDFVLRIGLIKQKLVEIEKYEPLRMETMKKKMETELQKHFDKKEIDNNRLEQELIYYIEKLDITEEKVRLISHCDYFIKTLDSDEDSKGRKLNFITQEIGREINTIGSKASSAEIQQLVVQMKDELEKVKEQTANIL